MQNCSNMNILTKFYCTLVVGSSNFCDKHEDLAFLKRTIVGISTTAKSITQG